MQKSQIQLRKDYSSMKEPLKNALKAVGITDARHYGESISGKSAEGLKKALRAVPEEKRRAIISNATSVGTESRLANDTNFGLGDKSDRWIVEAMRDKHLQKRLTMKMTPGQAQKFNELVNHKRKISQRNITSLIKDEGIKNLGNALGGSSVTNWNGAAENVQSGVHTASADATGNKNNPLNLTI